MEAAYSAKLFYILAQGNGAGVIWECSALVRRRVLIRNRLVKAVYVTVYPLQLATREAGPLVRTGSESGSRLNHEQSFRPAFAEMALYTAVMVILFFAAFFVFGLRMPQGASTGTTAIYAVVLFGIGLGALTAIQRVAITRLSGGTKPRLKWSAGHPPVFAPWHVPGAVLSKRGFALVCALPALCVVVALLPVCTLAFRAGV
jgi:hypothetical protein